MISDVGMNINLGLVYFSSIRGGNVGRGVFGFTEFVVDGEVIKFLKDL